MPLNTFIGWVIVLYRPLIQAVGKPKPATGFTEMNTIQPSQAIIDACDAVELLFVDTYKGDQDGVYIAKYLVNKGVSPIHDISLHQALN